MYEFSSKSQRLFVLLLIRRCCLRYCKCTSFQANHNCTLHCCREILVVCDTANVRVFKQITTTTNAILMLYELFAILQMYEFSSKSQLICTRKRNVRVVCDTANVRVFKQITTGCWLSRSCCCCLRYCKCTSFQANHNLLPMGSLYPMVVCDTANVRVFKQITTSVRAAFALDSCLRYCKCTSFQANHNSTELITCNKLVVCDTANVRVFKQITTAPANNTSENRCLRYCKCTSFQANHNLQFACELLPLVVCDTANVRVFKQITTSKLRPSNNAELFAILQMYEFSSKSQHVSMLSYSVNSCLRYCKCTSFQANHNR